MKKTIFTIIFSFAVLFVFAQSPISKGQMQLNVGLGFSPSSIPFYVGVDFGVHPDITAGVEASYHSTRLGVLGNGNYHFNRIMNIQKDWDVYAGLNIGASFDDSKSRLDLGAQLGGRYYFSDKMGVNLEFGGGNNISGGKIGITVKL